MEILGHEEKLLVKTLATSSTMNDTVKLQEVKWTDIFNGNFTNKQQCNVYYMKLIDALESSLKSAKYHELIPLYYQLANLCYQLGNYNQARYFCQKFNNYVTMYKAKKISELKRKITLIELLSYKKEYHYDDLFKKLTKVKKGIRKKEDHFLHQLIIIEAKTYMELNKYNLAQGCFELLLNKEYVDISIQKEVYLQSSVCYRYLGEVEKSKELFYQACHMIDLHQREFDVELLLEKAERNYQELKYNLALEDLKAIVEFLEKENIVEGLLKVYSLMGDIYASMGNLTGSKEYFSKIKNLLEAGKLVAMG